MTIHSARGERTPHGHRTRPTEAPPVTGLRPMDRVPLAHPADGSASFGTGTGLPSLRVRAEVRS